MTNSRRLASDVSPTWETSSDGSKATIDRCRRLLQRLRPSRNSEPLGSFSGKYASTAAPYRARYIRESNARRNAGVEVGMNWQATHRWTLSPGYALRRCMWCRSHKSGGCRPLTKPRGSSPDNSAQLRSHLLLWHGLSWDTSAYFVGRLRSPRASLLIETRHSTVLAFQGTRLSEFRRPESSEGPA